MFKKLGHWAVDYLRMIHTQSQAFYVLRPPAHYLGHVVRDKCPIVLIPGLHEKWHFFSAIVDPLSRLGHPIYILPRLGYHTMFTPHSARLVRELIEEKNLRDAVLIAHSKGGLVGKYLLAHHNQDHRVKKLIAIAAPFAGSAIVTYSLLKSAREFSPASELVQKLSQEKSVNAQIVSIFGTFDNHVWPVSSCRLDGAKNIEVEVNGHHKILFNKQVQDIVLAEVAE